MANSVIARLMPSALTEISDLDPNAEYLGRTGTVLSVYLSQGIAIYSTDGTSRVINKSNNSTKCAQNTRIHRLDSISRRYDKAQREHTDFTETERAG